MYVPREPAYGKLFDLYHQGPCIDSGALVTFCPRPPPPVALRWRRTHPAGLDARLPPGRSEGDNPLAPPHYHPGVVCR